VAVPDLSYGFRLAEGMRVKIAGAAELGHAQKTVYLCFGLSVEDPGATAALQNVMGLLKEFLIRKGGHFVSHSLSFLGN